jgi:outer membrane protein
MKILSALMLFAVLSGCASMRPTDPCKPVDLGGRPSLASRSGNQPIMVPDGSLTLQRAIDIALSNNPEVAARGWDSTAAQARRDTAFGARLPRLGAVGGYTRYLDNQRLIAASQDGEPGLFGRDILAGDLILSMPLFTGGRLVNQVRAAELLQEAADHRLVRSREELVFNVSSVFFNILAQRHVIDSLAFSRQTLTEHLKRIDALVEAQKAARVDRMRTEVRLAEVEQLLVREKNILAIQHRALASLLGLADHDEEISPQGELETQEKELLPDLATALAGAWKERADYLAARSSLEAQARNVDVAKTGHWPTVSVQGSYGGRWATGSTTGAGDETEDVGRVGLVLEVPIFQGGQVDAGIREQQASLAAAQERIRLLDLQVRLEVETALLNVESSDERAIAIRTSIAQAKESLRIEQQKYSLGKGAIVDVLDAQLALLVSETTYYRILADYHTAMAQLNLAMGEE